MGWFLCPGISKKKPKGQQIIKNHQDQISSSSGPLSFHKHFYLAFFTLHYLYLHYDTMYTWCVSLHLSFTVFYDYMLFVFLGSFCMIIFWICCVCAAHFSLIWWVVLWMFDLFFRTVDGCFYCEFEVNVRWFG